MIDCKCYGQILLNFIKHWMSKSFFSTLFTYNTLLILHIYEIGILSLSIFDSLCSTLPKVLYCTICSCKNSFVILANAKLFPIIKMWLTIEKPFWCTLITCMALMRQAKSAFLQHFKLLSVPLTHYCIYIYISHPIL